MNINMNIYNNCCDYMQSVVFADREKEMMSIYLCATMWHETKDEMQKMLISMFRYISTCKKK